MRTGRVVTEGRALLEMAVAAALAGCGTAPPCTPLSLAPPPIPKADYLARTAYPECSDPWRPGTSAVVRYAGATSDSIRHPERIIAGSHTGLCYPDAIARGPMGELYVLNHVPAMSRRGPNDERWAGWVTVYDSAARGDATPIRFLNLRTRGLGLPSSIGVDRAGYLYAGSEVDQYLDAGSVMVFEAGADGNVAPLRVVSGPNTGLRRPLEVALDRGGNLYVTNGKGGLPFPGELEQFLEFPFPVNAEDTVRVFAAASAGDVGPCRVIAGERTGLQNPVGLAVDRKNRLYVANGARSPSRPNTVTVYDAGAAGDTTPTRTITAKQIADRMREPRRVALDSHDSLYVKSSYNLTVFSPRPADSVGPARSFHRNPPDLFAFDRHDTLYTLAGDTVKVYPPGYAGAGAPVRTIHGPSTGIRSVTAMAVDRRGRLYLVVGDSSIVRVYAPGASGDVPPSRTIAGSHTGLRHPKDIALDRAGRLYLTNGPRKGGGGAVRVYAPGADGEDQPIRILKGPETLLSRPTDIVFDSRGDMYVSSTSGDVPGMVAVYRHEANGDEAPLRTIVGRPTSLRSPIALAFGRGDTLYAMNVVGRMMLCHFFQTGVNGAVAVYAPGASGDAEPVRSIVPKDGPRFLQDLTVDTSGSVTVVDPMRAATYAPGDSEAVAPVRTILKPGVEGGEPGIVTGAPDGTIYQTIVPRTLMCT